jgi:HK97 family phage major capsid protein/HK97 family phage prohead protease
MSRDTTIPEALRKQLQTGSLHRAFSVERRAVDEATRTATLAFASETPYQRFWGVEILDCTAPAIRMGRLNSGANLLVDHDTRDVVGVVESITLAADKVARAVVRFGRSARAEEVWRDVVDGIRRNVSVGYMIHKAQLVETKDGIETFRVTDWEPFEVSLVSVPADASVGVGRSLETVTVQVMVSGSQDDEEDPAADAAEDASEQTAGTSATAAPAADRSIPQPITSTRTTMQVETVEQRNHAAEISKLAASIQGAGELALKSIQAGHTVEQFQAEVLRTMANKPMPTPDIGLTHKEAQRYSITRAIRALVDRDWTGAGFERECNLAILKRSGVGEAPNGGFFVPYEVQKRDLTAGTGSQGGFLVQTDNLGNSFIDLLRNRTVVGQLGATVLSGLQGNVTIPRQSSANTAMWLTNEATGITETNAAFGQVALSPKHVGAYQEISRQLLMQSSPSVDMLVMNDLARVVAIAIDLAALEGSGNSGQPTGIASTASIGSVTGTSLAYAGILEFQTDVAGGNALAENCAYVTTPSVAALLSARQRFSSTDTPLWEGNLLDGRVSGFRAVSSLQLTAASMIFGDFSQVIIADWGMLEIAMNPYANFQAAITGIRAIQTCDVGVRYAAAFSRATSIT